MKPAALIFNTDPHNENGSHWVAIYIDQNGLGMHFDSYGLLPIIPQHLHRLQGLSTLFQLNTAELRIFTKLFSKNLAENDRIAVTFHEIIFEKYKIKPSLLNKSEDRFQGGNYNKGSNNTHFKSCAQFGSSKFATLYLA